MKFAGYDLLLLEGRASKPVYLFIYDDIVQIRDRERADGVDDPLIGKVGPVGDGEDHRHAGKVRHRRHRPLRCR